MDSLREATISNDSTKKNTKLKDMQNPFHWIQCIYTDLDKIVD